ncbi:molybdenum cofactor guanylyltransferase MobA [Erwinia tasmaniensis]|uniref:molybdenum cofactor guanylyltransferase MobA n=1 Tax=Erwinia tasmaniensis TaxID=338565 RepID=UPI003A4E23E6
MSRISFPPITGVILAGGQGSRMGGEDKGLIPWRGKPLYQHVLGRLSPQVSQLCISANRNISIYQQSGIPVFADTLPDFPGPLAGMLTALQNIANDWAVFAPCDTPELPDDLVARLWQEKKDASAVWARSGDRDHPTLALINVCLAGDLASFLAAGERRVMLFLKQAGGHAVSFDSCPAAFANLNSPSDLLGKSEAL